MHNDKAVGAFFVSATLTTIIIVSWVYWSIFLEIHSCIHFHYYPVTLPGV